MPRNDINLKAGLQGKGLENDVARQARQGLERGLAESRQKLTSIGVINEKSFRQPLGKITGQLGDFENALGASAARVLAFGLTASVLALVQRGFKEIVTAVIETEKALQDINVVFNLSEAQLESFSNGLFDVARQTGQSFQTVAVAATEFARQGLSAEETLTRVRDAMILTRLSGLSTTQSVETLTAAVNGFRREAITTTEAINRLANVDAAFAVSSADLANALSRSGSVAQDAKVSFNELIAATTAVQQATARGGSVIGNAFKTIFTRIQRSSVREVLEGIGIATTDLNGDFRSATDILSDYAEVYGTLTDAQKAYTGEQLAGVRQINILSALVKDLNSEYSVYRSALDVANSSTDEAIQRNERLNETLAALIERTKASGTEFAKTFGGLSLGSGLQTLLSTFENLFRILEGQLNEEKGSVLAQSFVKGIGDFIGGPGLIILGRVFFGLARYLGKFIVDAVASIQTLNAYAKENQQIQSSILAILDRDKALQLQIAAASGNRNKQENLILRAVQAQRREYERIQDVVRLTQTIAASGKVALGSGGIPILTGRRKAEGYLPERRASGYIPQGIRKQSFKQEESEARSLGASNSVRAMISDGTIGGKKFVKNSEEIEIPRFGRNGDSAVIPTYAAKGFVPNFAVDVARRGRSSSEIAARKAGLLKKQEDKAKKANFKFQNKVGVLVPFGEGGTKQETIPLSSFLNKTDKALLGSSAANKTATLGVSVSSFERAFTGSTAQKDIKQAENSFRAAINEQLSRPIVNIAKRIFGTFFSQSLRDEAPLFNNTFGKNLNRAVSKGTTGVVSKSAEGAIFESAVTVGSRAVKKGGLKEAVNALSADDDRTWDFEEAGPITSNLRKLAYQNERVYRADAKRQYGTDARASIFSKYFNTPEFSGDSGVSGIKSLLAEKRGSSSGVQKKRRMRRTKAEGYIPNFAFDPDGSGYDYESAIKSGIGPDSSGHWPSRVSSGPNEGLILKGSKHKTFYKTVGGEKAAGYGIYRGKDGRYYSGKGIESVSSPLSDAVERESKYVPDSKIRINKVPVKYQKDFGSKEIVTNTRDEKRGLKDVLEMGVVGNKARGHVPNFALRGAYSKVSDRFSKIKKSVTREEDVMSMGRDPLLRGAGVLFATQSILNSVESYAQSSGSKVGEELVSSISSGINVGIGATFLKFNPVVSAISGGVFALGKAILSLQDQTKSVTRQIEEHSASLQQNSDAAARAISAASQLNEAYKSANVENIKKATDSLNKSLSEIGDPALRSELIKAGSSVEDLQGVLAKFTESAVEQRKNLEKELIIAAAESWKQQIGRFFTGSEAFDKRFVQTTAGGIGSEIFQTNTQSIFDRAGFSQGDAQEIQKTTNAIAGFLDQIEAIGNERGLIQSQKKARTLGVIESARESGIDISALEQINLDEEQSIKRLSQQVQKIRSDIFEEEDSRIIGAYREEQNKLRNSKTAGTRLDLEEGFNRLFEGLNAELNRQLGNLKVRQKAFDPLFFENIKVAESRGNLRPGTLRKEATQREVRDIGTGQRAAFLQESFQALDKVRPEPVFDKTGDRVLNQPVIDAYERVTAGLIMGQDVTTEKIEEMTQYIKVYGDASSTDSKNMISTLQDIRTKGIEVKGQTNIDQIIARAASALEGLQQRNATLQKFGEKDVLGGALGVRASNTAAFYSATSPKASRETRDYLSTLENSQAAKKLEALLGNNTVARNLTNLTRSFSGRDITTTRQEVTAQGIFRNRRTTPQEQINFAKTLADKFIRENQNKFDILSQRATVRGGVTNQEALFFKKFAEAQEVSIQAGLQRQKIQEDSYVSRGGESRKERLERITSEQLRRSGVQTDERTGEFKLTDEIKLFRESVGGIGTEIYNALAPLLSTFGSGGVMEAHVRTMARIRTDLNIISGQIQQISRENRELLYRSQNPLPAQQPPQISSDAERASDRAVYDTARSMLPGS